ncbi:MAG: tetratricopeptide repeat protein [Bacteroidota bacterium]
METKRSSYQLPYGTLTASQEGEVELLVPVNYMDKGAMSDFFLLPHKIADEHNHWIWPRLKHQEPRNGHWVLEYPFKSGEFIPLSEMVTLWQQNLKIKFSEVVHFASVLSGFYYNCGHKKLSSPTPYTIYCNRKSHDLDWYILAIPAFDVSFEEWTNAAPATLEWFPLELIKKEDVFQKYLMGIVLHYCLVGNIHSPLLTQKESFKRWLQNRQEVSENLGGKIIQSLPDILGEEGQKLARDIEESINFKNVADNVLNPYRLGKGFSLYRLSTKWEYEGQLNIAIQILEDGHSNLFDVLARLYDKIGKPKTALNYYLKALENGQSEILGKMLLLLLKIVKKNSRFQYESLFKEVSIVANAELHKKQNSIYRLQMAYINLRFFKDTEKAKSFLIAGNEHPQNLDNWTRVLSNIIRAFIFYKQEKFSTVSKLCEEGVILVGNENKFPPGSFQGEQLRRAKMYFILLNGIAHISAVGKLKDYFYLNSAISLITDALDIAIILNEQHIIENAFQWLVFLKSLAIVFPPQIGPVIKTGINAYIQIKERTGVVFPTVQNQVPELPWFNENLFFSKINDQWTT